MDNVKFGVTEDTKSSNNVNYDKGGIKKAILTEVKFETVGRDDGNKYNVLSFNFLDHEGVKSFKHSEFEIQANDTDFNKKLEGMNSRIKHIYIAFAPFSKPLGAGATSFVDFFQKVATAFNTDNNGGPIFKNDKGAIPVWIKVAFYNKKGNIGFPLSPNFVERIGSDNKGTAIANQAEAKSLIIDNRYDKVDQPKTDAAPRGGVMGAGSPGGIVQSTDDGAF